MGQPARDRRSRGARRAGTHQRPVRQGIARPRLIQAGALAAVAALALAACGSAHAPGTGTAAVTGQTGGSGSQGTSGPPGSGPPGGSRAEALALAKEMQSKLTVPPGTSPLRGRLPQQLRQPGVMLGSATVVDVHRQFALTLSPQAAARFFGGHAPAGMRFQSNGVDGSPGQAGYALDLGYVPRPLPSSIYRGELDLTVIPGPGGGSLVRADAQVIWYLARTVAEHIDPAHLGAVRLSADLLGSTSRHVTKWITARSVITELAAMLNGMHASPRLIMSCPAVFASYRIGFAATAHSRPGVVATLGGCLSDTVSVGGRQQPSLLDPSQSLTTAVRHLLGVKQP